MNVILSSLNMYKSNVAAYELVYRNYTAYV